MILARRWLVRSDFVLVSFEIPSPSALKDSDDDKLVGYASYVFSRRRVPPAVDHHRLAGIAQAVIVHDVLAGGTVAVVSLGQDPVEGGVIRR